MIRPIGQSRRQPKIGMSRGKVSPKKSRRAGIHKLNRKAVRDLADRHPNALPRHKRGQFACRNCRAGANDPEQRKARTVEIGPLLAERILRGPAATDPDDIRSSIRTIRMSVAGETSSRSRRSAAWRTPRLSSVETLSMKR